MEINKKPRYKCCLVPTCKNSTIKTPHKIFLSVPKNENVRQKWLEIIKKGKENIKANTPLFCCEDHFNLEKDCENYMEYKLMKEQGEKVRLRLRKNVVPYIFNDNEKSNVELTQSSEPQRATEIKQYSKHEDCIMKEKAVQVEAYTKLTEDKSIQVLENLKENKSVQVYKKPSYRSKSISVHFKEQTKDVALSPFKASTNASTSCFNVKSVSGVKRKLLFVKEEGSDTPSPPPLSSSDYELSASSSTSDVSLYGNEDDSDRDFKIMMRNGTIMAIKKEPKLLLGLPEKAYYVINILADNVKTPILHILITLRKIKLNESFNVLALNFGFSQSSISRIFSKTVVLIANYLKELIVWPDREKILLNLPIPFRARYSNVVSIIDCLEIEIEKPSDPVHQALTWSQYKSCNTLKYLISCTPDGVITFISEGYGGRASDKCLIENSGYLDKLPANAAVMADRGFKNVCHLLSSKNCILIRPPSVSKNNASSKEDVLQSKRIAALRIHVERVIGRLREFNMLLPHARIDHNLVPQTDCIIKIACALVNMQDVLIKK